MPVRGQHDDAARVRELAASARRRRSGSRRRRSGASIAAWSPVRKCQPSAVPAGRSARGTRAFLARGQLRRLARVEARRRRRRTPCRRSKRERLQARDDAVQHHGAEHRALVVDEHQHHRPLAQKIAEAHRRAVLVAEARGRSGTAAPSFWSKPTSRRPGGATAALGEPTEATAPPARACEAAARRERSAASASRSRGAASAAVSRASPALQRLARWSPVATALRPTSSIARSIGMCATWRAPVDPAVGGADAASSRRRIVAQVGVGRRLELRGSADPARRGPGSRRRAAAAPDRGARSAPRKPRSRSHIRPRARDRDAAHPAGEDQNAAASRSRGRRRSARPPACGPRRVAGRRGGRAARASGHLSRVERLRDVGVVDRQQRGAPQLVRRRRRARDRRARSAPTRSSHERWKPAWASPAVPWNDGATCQ